MFCGVFDEPFIHTQTLALFAFIFSRIDLEYLPGARQSIKRGNRNVHVRGRAPGGFNKAWVWGGGKLNLKPASGAYQLGDLEQVTQSLQALISTCV